MDTLDVLEDICKKRKGFVTNGINVLDALIKEKHVIAEEYNISLTSIYKLIMLCRISGIKQSNI